MPQEAPAVVGMHRGGSWHGHTFIIIKGYAFNQAGGGGGIPKPYAKFRKVPWDQFIYNYENNAEGKWLQRFACLLDSQEVEGAYNYLEERFFTGTRHVQGYEETDPTTVLHQYNIAVANCAVVTSRALKTAGFIAEESNSPAGLASRLIRHRRAHQIDSIHPGGELEEPSSRLRAALEYLPGALVNWLMR